MAAHVVGVGMSKFTKPGTVSYVKNAKTAVTEALNDAEIDFKDVDAVVAGSVYTDSASGQRVLHEIGLTGIPVFNVNNNCSTGSSALMLARMLILSGQFQCVMAVGFEQMNEGLDPKYPKKVFPPGVHFDNLNQRPGVVHDTEQVRGTDPFTSDVIRLFAHATREYLAKYPQTQISDFATIAHKNRTMGAVNPKAALCNIPPPPMDAVATKRTLVTPITLHMSALTADGAAAAILGSDRFVKSYQTTSSKRLSQRAVTILAQHMKTDVGHTFETSVMNMSGYHLAKEAAEACFRDTNLSPSDIDIAEVHDCFASNELFMYEALGFTSEGSGANMVRSGKWVTNKAGGKHFQMKDRWVINPSGGIESKGHPIGATGLAQCYELVTQLRDEAGSRQVDGAKVALQHNYGIGSAAVVTMYKRLNDIAARSKL